MRCLPPIKGLQSINSIIVEDGKVQKFPTACRLVQLKNEEIEFYKKRSWLQNSNLNRDRIASNVSNGGVTGDSERVREIQTKITNLREGNDLLIQYIRQLFDLSLAPTRADLDFLYHLFRVDEEHLKGLTKSLKVGKKLIDCMSGNENREERLKERKENCNCKFCGCSDIAREKRSEENNTEREYVVINAPSTPGVLTTMQATHWSHISFENGSSNEKKKLEEKENLFLKMRGKDLTQKLLQCPYLDFNEYASSNDETRDFTELEEDMKKLETRMTELKNIPFVDPEVQDWDFVREDEVDKKDAVKDQPTQKVQQTQLKNIKKNKKRKITMLILDAFLTDLREMFYCSGNYIAFSQIE